jgi:hypothetical protein
MMKGAVDMKFIISGKNFEMTDPLRDRAIKKIGKDCGKYCDYPFCICVFHFGHPLSIILNNFEHI